MIDQANGVPPLSVHRLTLGRTWKGAGVVVGASLVDLQKMSGEGRGWHSDQDKLRLRPVGRISIHLHRGRLYFPGSYLAQGIIRHRA